MCDSPRPLHPNHNKSEPISSRRDCRRGTIKARGGHERRRHPKRAARTACVSTVPLSAPVTSVRLLFRDGLINSNFEWQRSAASDCNDEGTDCKALYHMWIVVFDEGRLRRYRSSGRLDSFLGFTRSKLYRRSSKLKSRLNLNVSPMVVWYISLFTQKCFRYIVAVLN